VRTLLCQVTKGMDIPLRYQRIYGYQSSVFHSQALTIAATALTVALPDHPPATLVEWDPISLHNYQGRITSHEGDYLRDAVSERDYIAFLYDNRGWSQPHIEAIDWDSRHAVMKNTAPAIFQFIVKASHGWLPTQSQQHRVDPRINAACPLCGRPETQSHIFQCPEQEPWRIEFLCSTTVLLQHTHTHPELRSSIVYCLGRWLHDDSPMSSYKGTGDAETGWERVLY
jgi:hypothetical protein